MASINEAINKSVKQTGIGTGSGKATLYTSMEQIKDKDGKWLRQSFMMPRNISNLADQRKQLFGDARFKFTDTTLGGNFAINPPPQFTRFADLRVSGRAASAYNSNNSVKDSGQGLGDYYSEAIDDNSQLVHFRFGVPEFNSLTSFFTSFYNSDAALMARTGRLNTSLAYKAGRALGFVATIPFAPLLLAGAAIKFVTGIPASKFYFIKNSMPLYWNAANSILNRLAVDMKLIPNVWTDEQKKVADLARNAGEENIVLPTADDVHAMGKLFSDFDSSIYYKNGGVDILAIATKATRKAIAHQKKLREILIDDAKDATMDVLASRVDAYLEEQVTMSNMRLEEDGAGGKLGPVDSAMKRWAESAMGSTAIFGETAADAATEKTNRGFWDTAKTFVPAPIMKAWDFYEAEMADGSDFVTFRVDYQSTTSESFNNATRDSELSSKINSTSQAAREARFNFAEGNFGGGLFNVVESVVGMAKDFAVAGLDAVQASGLASLAGSAFVDIPQHWDQSTANLPSASYNIQLRAVYGNKLSIYQNIMVPLALLLAGALPLAAGRHAYTSPFLCEFYCKGRNTIRLGIIDSISITRGAGNVGWSVDGLPLGIDVSFTVKDLSSAVHMAIEPSFSLNITEGVFDDDNAFNDYMSTLAGLSLNDLIYTWDHKLGLNLTRKAASFRKWTSPAKWANTMNYSNFIWPGRIINAIAREVDREGV